ncbi:hypothetical protein ACFSR7_36340 [Cohnella sp. GCM10020058]|uniref:hypothetical protein n=1 Tax=Cohnella sp. GCM10020058 TaxID=3317330 RepID=UPI0036396E43
MSDQHPGTFGPDNLQRCPICQNENVHLQAVEVNAGGVVSRIDHQIPNVRSGPPWGRGTLIRITQWGECGHSWVLQFYFHKGQTWQEIYETEQLPETKTDMWRD